MMNIDNTAACTLGLLESIIVAIAASDEDIDAPGLVQSDDAGSAAAGGISSSLFRFRIVGLKFRMFFPAWGSL